MNIPHSFLQKTKETWQPFYSEKLTDDDAREIAENFIGFFETLLEWDREKKKVSDDERDYSLRNTNPTHKA